MSYRKGRAFEYRCRDEFRDKELDSDRKAGSAPYDLIVRKGSRILYVCECKKTMKDRIYVKKEDIEKLEREAERKHVKPLFLYGFNRTPVYVKKPEELETSGKMYKVEDSNDHKELSEYLEENL